MPEAGGSLATYISPYNTEELLSGILKLSSKPDIRKDMEMKIKAGYKIQTWQQVASNLQNILMDL
jgi:DNA gyrase/topoisomerase IV subunit A